MNQVSGKPIYSYYFYDFVSINSRGFKKRKTKQKIKCHTLTTLPGKIFQEKPQIIFYCSACEDPLIFTFNIKAWLG